MSNEVVKKPEQTALLKGGKLSASRTSFQDRVRQNVVDIETLPHRICLMLDKSSSMNTYEASRSGSDSTRIELLKQALENFVQRCDFSNTAIAIETFPPSISIPLTNNLAVLSASSFGLDASGNTPMRACVERSLEKFKMTRGVIVSDGEATDWNRRNYSDDLDGEVGNCPTDDILFKYKQLGIPIDCVHISNDSGGEALLRRIAKETGGIFMKFTDVSSFAANFGYLTPGFRAMLTDGSLTAEQLGAKEIR